MRFSHSIRTKMIVFSILILSLFSSVLVLCVVGMNQIVRSANFIHTNYTPLFDVIHFAKFSVKDGQLLLDHLILKVRAPEEYDEIRGYEGRFKKTMVTFDMFISAMRFGSESEGFKKSSGGLNYAFWERERLDKKSAIKQAPLEMRMLLDKTDEYYKDFTRNALGIIKTYKKILRRTLSGQDKDVNNFIKELDGYHAQAEDAADKMFELLHQADEELSRHVSEEISFIGKTRHGIRKRMIILIGVLCIIAFLFTVFFAEKLIVRPIRILKKAIRGTGKGDLDKKIHIDTKGEIGELADSFNEMQVKLKKSMVSCDELAEEVRERKETEKRLQCVAEELESVNTKLKESASQMVQAEKLSAIGEISAGVAHEMTQPLNVIKIICQSLLKEIEKGSFNQKEASEEIPEIVTQINRLAEIIDHMRIFSRRTEGAMQEMINVNNVVENTFIFLGQQLKAHGVKVTKELAANLPKVKGEAIRLEQVFMNLINNARYELDSAGKESKEIKIKSYKVEGEEAVAVEVEDNGPGIPDDLKEKIFKSFFTTKEEGKGTGLGLSISRKILKEHGGRIEMESKVGEGTMFRVILPAGNIKQSEKIG